MKALRIITFILGLLSWVRPFLYRFSSKGVVDMQAQELASSVIINLFMAVICAVFCVLLAKKLNRLTVGWGIFGFFVPYIACLIIPFLKERDPNAKRTSWWNTGGSSWGSSYGGTSYYGEKTCSRCGRVVPYSSRAGQSCPHCGAYWSTETQKRKY